MDAPHAAFAKRLQTALDLNNFAKGRERTGKLADAYGVSRETARKWLNGLALPELERMIDLATRFDVGFEWLATGRGGQQVGNGIAESMPAYNVADREDARLFGIVRALPREKRKALLMLLGS